MLTDQQIEAAARKLCSLRGIDPDRDILCGAYTPESIAARFIPAHAPAWQTAANEIRFADQVREAIASVTPELSVSFVAEKAMPGPCECGHPRAVHVFTGEKNGQPVLGCGRCHCAGYFEFSAP